MPNHNLPHTGAIAASHQDLGPNEKAILDSPKLTILKKLFTATWRIKLRLQFTGWLQYIPVLIFALVFFVIAGIIHLLGYVQAAAPFFFVGVCLSAVLIFDLTTVKFRLRLPEHLPKRNDDLNLFDLMRSRCSCRSFQTRKLTAADYNELMASVRLHSAELRIGQAPIRFEYIAAPLTV